MTPLCLQGCSLPALRCCCLGDTLAGSRAALMALLCSIGINVRDTVVVSLILGRRPRERCIRLSGSRMRR